jgi:hypothetical protein
MLLAQEAQNTYEICQRSVSTVNDLQTLLERILSGVDIPSCLSFDTS